MALILREIVFDCTDPQRVADFWCAALGWEVKDSGRGFLYASELDEDDPAAFFLVFLPGAGDKQGKNRVHVDLSPRGSDQAAEVARLEALGAVRVDVGQGDAPWVVLADPEGNELCVLGRHVD